VPGRGGGALYRGKRLLRGVVWGLSDGRCVGVECTRIHDRVFFFQLVFTVSCFVEFFNVPVGARNPLQKNFPVQQKKRKRMGVWGRVVYKGGAGDSGAGQRGQLVIELGFGAGDGVGGLFVAGPAVGWLSLHLTSRGGGYWGWVNCLGFFFEGGGGPLRLMLYGGR